MDEPQQIDSGVASEMNVANSIRLSMRHYFTTNFLWAALHTSWLAGELDATKGERPRFDMAHRSLAASSVIASATFLEAAVSELFQDAHDRHGLREDGYLAPLRSDAVAAMAMAMVWRATNSGLSLDPLEKWQWLLECCGRARSSAVNRERKTQLS